MPNRKLICALGFFVMNFATAISVAVANDEVKRHIFLIQTEARSQTGFRLVGTAGIVTALHGVVDANQITARPSVAGMRVTKPLKIIKVDIEHDLALISSAEVSKLPD